MGSRHMNCHIWGSREKQCQALGRMSSCICPVSSLMSLHFRGYTLPLDTPKHTDEEGSAGLVCTPWLLLGFQQMHKTGAHNRRPGLQSRLTLFSQGCRAGK